MEIEKIFKIQRFNEYYELKLDKIYNIKDKMYKKYYK